MKLLAAAAGAALLTLPISTPLAQDRPAGGACRADVERLCPDAAEPRAAFQCLRDKQAEVSEDCKKQLAEGRRGRGGRAGMRKALQACRGDLEKHCSDVERGGGRLGACLQEHADDLTDQCREALDGLRR